MRHTPRTVFVALAALAALVISTVPAAAATAAPATWWKPVAGATWQMQFTGALDTSVAVDVYDIDGADATKAQVTKLQPSFDFAVKESCAQWKECAMLSPFVTAGKPVFHVEYKASLCPTATSLRFSSIRKNLRLDAFRATC